MNKIFLFLIFSFLLIKPSFSQITVNSKYFHSSEYSSSSDTHTGNVNTLLLTGSVNLPISMKISPNRDTIRVWTGFINAKYLKMNGLDTPEPYHIDEILNMNTGISHFRSLSKRWNLLVIGGLGLSTADTRFSSIKWHNVMVYAVGTAIYKVNDKLDIGGGLIVTNAYNTPIALPALYVNWKGEGKYSFSLISRVYDIQSSLGMQVNPWLKLSLIADYGRVSTPYEDADDYDYYYSFNYLTTGLRPEFKVSKRLTIPIEIGAVFGGSGSYKKRRLANILKSEESYDFGVCPYFSIGLKFR